MEFAEAAEQVISGLEKVEPRFFEYNDRDAVLTSLWHLESYADRLVDNMLQWKGKLEPAVADFDASEWERKEVKSVFAAFGISPQKFADLLEITGDPCTEIAKMVNRSVMVDPQSTLLVEAARIAFLSKTVDRFDINC
jgi:hypothetical protein